MEIKIMETRNRQMIRRLLIDAEWLLPLLDDEPVDTDKFEPDVGHGYMKWLVVVAEDRPVGIWLLEKKNYITWQLYVTYAPDVWDTDVIAASGKPALDKAFEITKAKKLVALVPCTYKNIVDLTKSIGMKIEGTCKRSWQKGGEVLDSYHMGVYR